MILTFMAQNMQFGGNRDGEGQSADRWPLLAKRINSVVPDILLLQEAAEWGRFGQKYVARAMNDLSLEALPLAKTKSGNGTAILYRQSKVGHWQRWNDDYAQETVHGFGVAAFDVNLPRYLSIVSAHLTPFGSDEAIKEAALIANRAYRYGPYAIIGGDMNYAPAQGPAPDYTTMRPFNVAMRTALTDPSQPSQLTPDRRVGWKLAQSGFVDVAYRLYERTKDMSYLARTASDDRIDQFWVSRPLAEAIIDYKLIDVPAEASDHKGIVFRLDTDKIDVTLAWDYHQ